MKTFETSWKTHDGVEIFAQGWEPDGAQKGVVCLVHGLGDHSGRYANVGAALTSAGYVLAAMDLRGHGKSGGPRGHSPSFESLMQDLDLFIEETRKRYPSLPRFLWGHSLGGILVLNFGIRRTADLTGIIATSAALRHALEQQKAKVAVAKILGTLLPATAMASGLDPNSISRDPAVVQAYTTDPLVHNRISLGMSKQMLGASPYALRHASEFRLPLLIMHGGGDLIGFASGSEEFAAAVPGDCTLKIWEGLYHEMHNEPEKEQVFRFITEWLDLHSVAR